MVWASPTMLFSFSAKTVNFPLIDLLFHRTPENTITRKRRKHETSLYFIGHSHFIGRLLYPAEK